MKLENLKMSLEIFSDSNKHKGGAHKHCKHRLVISSFATPRKTKAASKNIKEKEGGFRCIVITSKVYFYIF